MSTDITAALEPTYSAREAAAVLKRSYSWLDQRLRRGEFARPDGTVVPPLRSPGGYRYRTFAMLRDIAACCSRNGWYSIEELKSVLRELVMEAYRDTGEGEIPRLRGCLGSSTDTGSGPQPVRSRASNFSSPQTQRSELQVHSTANTAWRTKRLDRFVSIEQVDTF